MNPIRIALFAVAVLTVWGPGAPAQTAPAQTAPARPRPFDRFPGLVVACTPVVSLGWTVDGCKRLLAATKARAAAAKLRIAEVPGARDLWRRRFGMMDGFDGDKALRVNWVFEQVGSGRVNLSLHSSWIWEPTAKDIPNVVPGQRLPRNLYLVAAWFDPDISVGKAQPAMDALLDNLFKIGEGQLSPQ